MKKFVKLFILVVLTMFVSMVAFANEATLEQRMDDYTKSIRIQWHTNPLRTLESDRYFNPWLDQDSYNSSYWMGSILNMEELYDAEKFKLDSVAFYHAPKLGTELKVFSLHLKEGIHRFNIGLGFLVDFTFLFYKNGADQLYGESFLFGSFVQVEPVLDYIYKDKFRLRVSPVKHICYHMGGDILGDSSLYDRSIEEFRDVGFEQIHLSAAYRWGWFTFHGGLSGAYTAYSASNVVNVLNMNVGTEFRFPIWGEINLLVGLMTGTNFDIINTITRPAAGTGYTVTAASYEWTPIVSVGLGIEIYRMAVGVKYEMQRSRQIYAFRKMEHRLGLSANLFI